MVKPKGWDGVKPYWWCDTEETRAVQDHLWRHLVHHPENGIYIKGVEKGRPESIEVNCFNEIPIVNINTIISDEELRVNIAESVALVMEDAVIDCHHYTLRSANHFKTKNTYNLQYKWQQLERKSKHSEH